MAELQSDFEEVNSPKKKVRPEKKLLGLDDPPETEEGVLCRRVTQAGIIKNTVVERNFSEWMTFASLFLTQGASLDAKVLLVESQKEITRMFFAYRSLEARG